MNRRGSTLLAAALCTVGVVLLASMAASMRSSATNRFLDAGRARRVLSVATRSTASEASYVLEELCAPLLQQGHFRERSEKLHDGGRPRTVEVPLTRAYLSTQRVTIGPVTAVFTPLKRHWDKNRGKGEKPEGNGADPGEFAADPGGGGDAGPEEQPPADDEGGGGSPEGGSSAAGAGAGGEDPFDEGPQPDGDGAAGGAPESKGPGKWRKRGAWAIVQLKFDVTVETLGKPLHKRISLRRYVMVRRWGWHPMRIDGMDVAYSQEAIP